MRFLAMALLPLLTAACASSGTTVSTNTTAEVATPYSADAADLEALYWARQDSAKMNFSEEEAAFMTGMIGHHAQALIMSDLADANDAGSAVRTLAARIINAQKDESESMQRWLRERDQPVPEVHIDGLNLMLHGIEGHDHMHMAGMLSEEQLQALAAARGSAFDRLFLEYMIQHHRGAVTMVRTLFDSDGAGQDETAFKIASDINVDQLTEIARMEGMLAAMGGPLSQQN